MTTRGRKVRGVFERDGQWWIRWACSLGHDHRQPSGDSKTAAGEEHKAKRAEVRDARKAGQECCPKLIQRERPAMADVNLYTVQRAGGWKTQVMVQRYAHLSPDHMRTAVERLANSARKGATDSKTGTTSQ